MLQTHESSAASMNPVSESLESTSPGSTIPNFNLGFQFELDSGSNTSEPVPASQIATDQALGCTQQTISRSNLATNAMYQGMQQTDLVSTLPTMFGCVYGGTFNINLNYPAPQNKYMSF